MTTPPTEIEDPNSLHVLAEDNTPEVIKEYYDEFAKSYDQTLKRWNYKAPVQAAELLTHHVPADGVILDAGCGTGLTGQALQNAGFQTIDGIDLSPESLKLAEETGAYRSVKQVNMKELPLPFEDNTFDAIECIGVLTYLDNSEALFKEFQRISKPGGTFVFTQRVDIFEARRFDDLLPKLEAEGVFQIEKIFEPRLYLPEHQAFGDQILVIFGRCTFM